MTYSVLSALELGALSVVGSVEARLWIYPRLLTEPHALCYADYQMTWQDRINIDSKVLVGKPVVTGTRISVEMVLDLLARGWTQEQILDSYPNLAAEDIRACLGYASEILHAERVYPLTSA